MKKRSIIVLVAGGLLAAMLPGTVVAQTIQADGTASAYAWDGRLASTTTPEYAWDGRLASSTPGYASDGRLASSTTPELALTK